MSSITNTKLDLTALFGGPDDNVILLPSPQAKYAVIGNFTTAQNARTDELFNVASGLNLKSFKTVIEEMCEKYNLGESLDFGDSAVIECTPAMYTQIQKELGHRFSFAYIDEESLEYMKEQEEDYQNQDFFDPQKVASKRAASMFFDA